jgi:hypothetical protein
MNRMFQSPTALVVGGADMCTIPRVLIPRLYHGPIRKSAVELQCGDVEAEVLDVVGGWGLIGNNAAP